jgi:isopenicillin N synthase-like dioxygenase
VAPSCSANPLLKGDPGQFDPTIPVLDMLDFHDPSRRGQFVADMAQALREVGFFAVLNPGVDMAALDRAYASAQAFFACSPREKLQVCDLSNNGQRGYVPGESAKGESTGDFKEFFHVGRTLTAEQEERLAYSPNLWPKTMELQSPLTELFSALEVHMLPLQEALAEALGEPANFLSDMTKEGDVLLRAIHYPPHPPEGQEWAAAHTDINLFTILPRATARGLQVQNEAGDWVDVIVPEGAFVVNCGDMLQNLSNGEFRSARHRVVDSGEGCDRYSMVLFVHPRSEDDLSPRPQCIARTGGVQKYPNANRLELLSERLVELGLASDSMVEYLAQSGLMERQLDLGRASPEAMQVIYERGLASERVTHAVNEHSL